MKRAALLADQRLMNGLEPVAQGIVIALAVHFQQYAANELGIHLFAQGNLVAGHAAQLEPPLSARRLRQGALVVTQASVTP